MRNHHFGRIVIVELSTISRFFVIRRDGTVSTRLTDGEQSAPWTSCDRTWAARYIANYRNQVGNVVVRQFTSGY